MQVWLVKFLRQKKILSESFVWYFELKLSLARAEDSAVVKKR